MENEPDVKEINFNEIKKEDFGLVVTGAGKPYKAWCDVIAEMLKKENIVKIEERVFEKAAVIKGNIAGDSGRTDLLLLFNKMQNIDIGKLAVWRIRFGGISWVDDFIDNYGKDYGLKMD